MPAKVTFSVTKGGLAGKKFIYGEKEALILGRQEECAIALPENTVSRYHCMIEVNPPEVTVRDFGSLERHLFEWEEDRTAGKRRIRGRSAGGNAYRISAESG